MLCRQSVADSRVNVPGSEAPATLPLTNFRAKPGQR